MFGCSASGRPTWSGTGTIMTDSSDSIRSRPILWLPLAAGAGFLLLLYKDTFGSWWDEWTSNGSFYAHAMFVPFFVALMVIWQNRAKIDRTRWKPSWLGAGSVAFGMLMFLAGQRLDVVAVKSLSFMFVLLGACLMLLGIPRTRVLLLPIVFVIMMMPLIPDPDH